MADKQPYPGPPRWVKVSGIVVIVLAVLVLIVMFAGVGGEHGPGRHAPTGNAAPTLPGLAGHQFAEFPDHHQGV
ncbi:MAG: hypothetical protein WD314_10615 [Trueperaceae bacterium]